ncbi:MAG TPA: tetratricopeptide repeat protein [Polyangiaceae bacterium]
MDVQCERCKTEYDFDDALVSGRGTTVRCTNCGHQFKVRKQEASEPGADRWVVRTSTGQELTFLTLRELQRAILAKQVGRADVLRRGQAPPRTLHTIAELEPFFEGRASSRPPPGIPGAPPPQRLPPSPGVPHVDGPDMFPKRTASWGTAPEPPPPLPPVRRKIDTLRPPLAAGAAPPPAPPMTPIPTPAAPVVVQPAQVVHAYSQVPMSRGSEDPITLRRPNPTPPPPPVRVHSAPPAAPQPHQPPAPSPAYGEMSSPLPPPTVPVRRSYGDEDLGEMRRPMSSRDDLYAVPKRRRVGGWIVAFVLMLAVGVVGWVVAKPYFLPHPAAATAQLDPRAQGFVTDGERALADGNLDGAQQAFDKASGIAERDPHVLVDEARVACAKADVPWLKSRLLPADAKDEARTTKADLDDRVSLARKAADAAVAVAPDDAGAVRTRIDSLRLAGERDTARRDVSKIIAQASQPETAYVLAALDLAEPDPLWTTLVDRLRLAAAGEGNAGRARAALVYALAQSGDVAAAKVELTKLDAMTRPYPLLHNLHAFLDKMPVKGSALDAGVASSVPVVAVSALPSQPAAPGAPPGAGGAGGGGSDEPAVPGETTSAMKAAQAAIRKGDWERARTIYGALVSRNPGDSEALAGLGDVSRATGDTAGALSAYRRALAVNPSYLPALLGVADTQWASGDHASALRAYKDISDRFPEGTYPGYVKSRLDAASAPAPATAPTGMPTASSTAVKNAAPAPSDGI